MSHDAPDSTSTTAGRQDAAPPVLPTLPFARWPRWLRPAVDSSMADTVASGRSPWGHALPLFGVTPVPITVLMMGQHLPAAGWWLGLSMPLFLLLYALSLWLPQRQGGWVAVVMIAASLLVLPWFPPTMSYFIFGAVLLRVFPGPSNLAYAGWAMLANVVFCALVVALGWDWQRFVWVPVLTLMVVTIVANTHSNDARERLLQRSQAAVRAQASAAERERIGRDLHDLLGHTLSLITLKLELSRKLAASDPQRSRSEADEAEQVARQALEQVRNAVTGMRATGLHGEIASAGLLLECAGVRWQPQPPPNLPEALDAALSLVLREAVTNISRHADARRAWLDFVLEPGRVGLQIGDDGRGYSGRQGNGVNGMQERVQALGGSLSIQRGQRGGTCLQVWLPLPAAGQSGP